MSKRKVLAIVSFMPYPKNHGDALRRSMLLEELNRTSRLTVFVVERPDTDDAARRMMSDSLEGARIEYFRPTIGPSRRVLARVRRVLHGMASFKPPWLYSQWSKDLRRRVRDLTENFDFVFYVGEPSAVDLVKLTCWSVWDKSNVLTASALEGWRTLKLPMERVISLLSAGPSHLFEKRTGRRVKEVWVTSDEEASRFRELFSAARVHVLASAVEEARQRVQISSGGDWVWMSSFHYPPNWDGLRQLLSAIEQLRAPIRLRVIGAGATRPQVTYLKRFSFVSYLGYQEDLHDACNGATGAVVPLWSGAGVKLKTLTLIQLGLPLVATPVAMEGVPSTAAYRIATSPTDVVEAMVAAQDADLRGVPGAAVEAIATDLSASAFREGVQRLFLQADHAATAAAITNTRRSRE